MVATATLAPLPSFLAEGNVYAATKMSIGIVTQSASKSPIDTSTKVADELPTDNVAKVADKPPTDNVAKVADKPPVAKNFITNIIGDFIRKALSSSSNKASDKGPSTPTSTHSIGDKAFSKGPSTPTSTYSAGDIKVNNLAVLLASNTVHITRHYKCSNDAGGTTIHVTLTQQPPEVPNTVVGSNTANVICDNQFHPVTVPITADNKTSKFNAGKATVTATLIDAQGKPVGDPYTSPITII